MAGNAHALASPDSVTSLPNRSGEVPDMVLLQQKLGYCFNSQDLLRQALTHRSFGLDQGTGVDSESPLPEETLPCATAG